MKIEKNPLRNVWFCTLKLWAFTYISKGKHLGSPLNLKNQKAYKLETLLKKTRVFVLWNTHQSRDWPDFFANQYRQRGPLSILWGDFPFPWNWVILTIKAVKKLFQKFLTGSKSPHGVESGPLWWYYLLTSRQSRRRKRLQHVLLNAQTNVLKIIFK